MGETMLILTGICFLYAKLRSEAKDQANKINIRLNEIEEILKQLK